MRGLQEKVVIVTGAGQGIGKATAQSFSDEGARVVVAEFNEKTGKSVVAELESNGAEALFIQTNVANRDSVRNLISVVLEKFGRIDVLVNNAGVLRDNTLKKMTDDEFDQVMDVNLRGTFICGQEVAAVMREQSSGVILNASSVVALYGNFGQTNYVASKAGVIGMTKVWARELGKDGIRVNAVTPGFIETAMTEGIPDKVLEMMMTRVPLRRMGSPEDVAAAYCFLASDDAAYITGQVLGVDGGSVT